MKKFQEIVPLGFLCMVAQDLEKMGMRNNSYPFDWVITDFSDVIAIIKNGFSEFLQDVCQDEEHDNVYHDVKTGVAYYHDFFPDKTIEQQIDAVRVKYSRRIARFYETAKNPTLYIRFVRNERDLAYIEDSFSEIEDIFKNLNSQSECVYILSKELAQTTKLRKYFVAEGLDHPILSSGELRGFIKKTVAISKRKYLKNRIRYIKKALKKRLGR